MRWLVTREVNKHTYLASCHHVGEFGMLIDCQAQNVVTVFYIETLAGCEETHPTPTHTHTQIQKIQTRICYTCSQVGNSYTVRDSP